MNQADSEEEHRLLYVAATRARDVLIVPGGGDGAIQGWTTPLERALRPKSAMRPSEAVGCPPLGRDGLGDDTVGYRPSEVHDNDPLQPGLYALAESLDVVWWGPAALPQASRERVALRRADLLQKPASDVPSSGVKMNEREKAARKREGRIEDAKGLREEREPLAMFAEKPLASASTECETEEVRIAVPDIEAIKNAPRFEPLMRGAMVVLAGGGEVASAVRYVRRSLGLSETTEALAIACMEAMFRSDAWTQLRAAPEIETDVWVTLATLMGTLTEGRVPVVTTHADEVRAFGVSLEAETAKRSVELALAATAVGKDRAKRPHSTLFVLV